TLDPIMAPNIQLAGNFAILSSSAVDTDAPIKPASPSGEATLMGNVGAEEDVIPVSASTSGSAAVRAITRSVCTTAIPETSASFSMARMVICDSAPGLAARNA